MSPIAEDPEQLQEQEEWEENQEHLEQEAPGNIPKFTTPTDEVLGDQFEDQLQDQLEEQEEWTEEEVTDLDQDQDDATLDKEVSRGGTNNNWCTPLDEAPGHGGH